MGGPAPTPFDSMDLRTPRRPANFSDPTEVWVHLILDNTRGRVAASRAAETSAASPTPPPRAGLVSDNTRGSRAAALPPTSTQTLAPTTSGPAPESPEATRRRPRRRKHAATCQPAPGDSPVSAPILPPVPETPPLPPRPTDTTTRRG